jgi:hypothetical protein
VADPLFVDPARGDFHLKPGSPALKLGIRSIDTSRNGLVGRSEWVNLPKQARFPATVLPRALFPPQPAPVDDGFETTSVGQPPAGAIDSEENRGDSLRVTDEMAASGKHCLKFTDAPGLTHIFNPHMYYAPHFAEGRAVLSFDARLQKGAIFAHEWRDAAQPYRLGPSLVIDAAGKLTANGKPLADVPIENWFHVEIVCPLGKKAKGAYDLVLTVSGQPPKRFPSLPCGTPKFNRLEWLGFVSLASNKTVFHLDNIRLQLVDDKGGK